MSFFPLSCSLYSIPVPSDDGRCNSIGDSRDRSSILSIIVEEKVCESDLLSSHFRIFTLSTRCRRRSVVLFVAWSRDWVKRPGFSDGSRVSKRVYPVLAHLI